MARRPPPDEPSHHALTQAELGGEPLGATELEEPIG
jgi:hypothetical protein